MYTDILMRYIQVNAASIVIIVIEIARGTLRYTGKQFALAIKGI